VVKPTEFGAVDITVYDASPDTAYEMVKGILDILNKKILQVQEEKSVEVADMWKKQVDLKKHQVDSMENLSKQLSTQYGLLEYGNQTKEVSRAYYQALAAGKGSKQYDELALQLKNMQEHGIEFKLTNQHVEAAVNDYNALELKYEDALKDVNKQLTFWNMVSAPYKPDTYCYPIRSLIVLGTCLAALLFSIVFMRGAERIKE
jgi:capsule polysaccharide export protein KpsE/RkpR